MLLFMILFEMQGNQNNSVRFYDILQYNVILILFPDFSSSCGMFRHFLGPSYMAPGCQNRLMHRDVIVYILAHEPYDFTHRMRLSFYK